MAPNRFGCTQIPFRYCEADAKFKKYDMVNMKVTPAVKDRRPESYTLILNSLTIVSHLEPWKPRHSASTDSVDRMKLLGHRITKNICINGPVRCPCTEPS